MDGISFLQPHQWLSSLQWMYATVVYRRHRVPCAGVHSTYGNLRVRYTCFYGSSLSLCFNNGSWYESASTRVHVPLGKYVALLETQNSTGCNRCTVYKLDRHRCIFDSIRIIFIVILMGPWRHQLTNASYVMKFTIHCSTRSKTNSININGWKRLNNGTVPKPKIALKSTAQICMTAE